MMTDKVFNKEAGEALLKICASSKTTVEDVRALLDAGADPNYRPHEWAWTPLMDAARYNMHPDIIRILIAAGADVMTRHDNGAGHIALSCARTPEVIEALLEKDAALQLADRHLLKGTHLSDKVLDNTAACVEVMLRYGADPDPLVNKERPPLQWAIIREDYDKIDVLLDYSPEKQINFVDPDSGQNIAMLYMNAAHFNSFLESNNKKSYAIMTRIMNLGIDFSHKDKQRRTLKDHILNTVDAKVRNNLLAIYDAALEKRAYDVKLTHAMPVKKMAPKKGPKT